MKQNASKIKRIALTALAAVCALSSVAAISASAASTEVTATSSKVSVTLRNSTYTTLIVNKVSCREKHSGTNAVSTVTGSNSTGNGTSLSEVIYPHTGYKFIVATKTYNYYKYTIGSNVSDTIKLPTIS